MKPARAKFFTVEMVEAYLNSTRHFLYNEKRELVSANTISTGGTQPPGASLSSFNYSYDAIGNRVQGSAPVPGAGEGVPPETTFYTVNSVNQYTQIGNEVPTYDANGNTLTTPVGISTGGTQPPGASSSNVSGLFTYDQENRLVSATVNGVKETYLYDGLGRRVETRVFKVSFWDM